jgi:predicted nuclease of predicted toxin-antitoxin system
VKLLFDENLSPRLVDALRDVYPESQHVVRAFLEKDAETCLMLGRVGIDPTHAR